MSQNNSKPTQAPVNVVNKPENTQAKPAVTNVGASLKPVATTPASTPAAKAEAPKTEAPKKVETATKPAAATKPALKKARKTTKKTAKKAKKTTEKVTQTAKKQARELENVAEATVYEMTDRMATGGRKQVETLAENGKVLAEANHHLHQEARKEMDTMFAENVQLAKDLLSCRTFNDFVELQNRAVQQQVSHMINQGAQVTNWWLSLTGAQADTARSTASKPKAAKTAKPAAKNKKRGPGRPKKRAS